MYSPLHLERSAEVPPLPNVLKGAISLTPSEDRLCSADDAEQEAKIAELFPKTFGKGICHVVSGDLAPTTPLKVGVVLSGGQAPGGHNVIAGIFDYVKRAGGKCFGFLNGPRGVYNGVYEEITEEWMKMYRNLGGFHMIGSGRDKFDSIERLNLALDVLKKGEFDGLVVIGGDDSNTNAALLAEHLLKAGHTKCKVIGCPKTIDGDLKNAFIHTSFGFDTATKIYSELVGNIQADALSAKKYYHFIKIMGRDASHVALEVALKARPNYALLSEVVAAREQSLLSIAKELADVVIERANDDKNYGVVLVAEGLIEHIPELHRLFEELNLRSEELKEEKNPVKIIEVLSEQNSKTFASLPRVIQEQLLEDRDPHGNVQVSKIETERLVRIVLVEELQRRAAELPKDWSLNSQCHFFGYEGRCGFPSIFDTNYCYSLGYNAGILCEYASTGLMSSVTNLDAPVEDWLCAGIPISGMLHMELKKGKMVPVIKKAFMDLKGKPFSFFASNRRAWAVGDHYQFPGPVQFQGGVSSAISETLQMEIEQRREGFAVPDEAQDYPALLAKSDPGNPEDREVLTNYRLRHGLTDAQHAEMAAKME